MFQEQELSERTVNNGAKFLQVILTIMIVA